MSRENLAATRKRKMRETRHLWIGNLPESIREERIAEHFKRYGKIDKVRFLPKRSSENGISACVAFMDIRSAQKAKAAANVIGDRQLVTNYFDPTSRASGSSSQQTGRNAEEASQRHSHTSGHRTNPPHGNRRYEGHRDGAIEDKDGYGERYIKDRPSVLDKRFELVEGRGDSYDSDRSKGRSSEGAEKEKIGTHVSADAKSEPASKRHKAESTSGKISKKKSRKIAEDSKPGGSVKKGKKKTKERGRSPTVKHKKKSSSHTRISQSPMSSPATSAKKQKAITSSTDGSTTSGTRSGSTSGSVRSSSSSSTASSSSTNTSRSHSSNSSSSESSYETEGGPNHKKLVAMCIKKLPTRPTVTSLRDGIFHEFKKYGKVKSVVIRGDGAERYALVLFRTAAEANKAISHAKSKLLFGAAIEASIYEGEVSGQELEECGGIIDEFHPRASRTLFVGNLDKTVGYSDIQNIFVRFGEIVAIEIKKQHNVPQYAFLQYTDIAGVVRAITKMDGEKLGRNTLKLGFGKTVISSCLWVDGVTDSFTENYLASCFQRYGLVKHVVIDRNRGRALVFYARYEDAQTTMAKMRARKLNGSRLKMDYASNELIDIFLKHMQSSGQSIQGLENIRQLLQPPPSPTSSMPNPNVLSNTLPPVTGSSNHHFTRPPPDIRPYYDEHVPLTYTDIPSGPYVATEPSYRRQWRGRSRERYLHPSEASSHGRHSKRIYEENFERSDYHRDQSPPAWDFDSNYPERRPTPAAHFDHDYRPKDYDIRREHRPYVRKASGVAGGSYPDTYHHRGSRDRDRGREGDRGREVERDRVVNRPIEAYSHYSRSAYSSPTHSRYLSRRSRSISPGSASRHREPEHASSDRLHVDPSGFRRRGHSGTRSPESQTEYLQNRRNSVESKTSSSHSGTRYAPRSGDVDMRENLSPKVDSEEKVIATIRAGDERIVEFREKPNKGRVRSKVVSDSPRDSMDSSPKRRHHPAVQGCRSSEAGSDREIYSRRHGRDNVQGAAWQSTRSPEYSESYSGNRSRSGTPTRDENQDSIGEVIIKQPTVSSSVVKAGVKKAEKDRTKTEKKIHPDLEHRDRNKPRDKDYRKAEDRHADTVCPDDRSSSGSSKHSAKHSKSSLIKRVHSPVTLEREGGTKDFDYRKHQTVRASKSGGSLVHREKLSRHEFGDRHGPSRSVDDIEEGKSNRSRSPLPVSSSHRGHQDPATRQRSGGSNAAKLIKREYSPGSGPEQRYNPKKKNPEWTKDDAERQRSLRKEQEYLSSPRVKDERSSGKISRENIEDVDDRRYLPVKRRHSLDMQDDDSLNFAPKRERKSSVTESNLTKSKGGHHHLKHEAPMSIARQMFLQEEDDSGADSPRDIRAKISTQAVTLPMTLILEDKGVKIETLDADDEQKINNETMPSQEDVCSVKKRISRWEVEVDESIPPELEEKDIQPTSVSIDYPDVTIASAKSLLPRRLPKVPLQAASEAIGEDVSKSNKTQAARDSKGNLLDLEREKKRLQELLSKLDSENLDVKDAEEVADVVLKELAEKAKSKLLASKPVSTKSQETVTPMPTFQANSFDCKPAEEEVEIGSVLEVKCEEVLEEEMTVEEEIVMDSYEEVTSNEDEVIETVVEEESVMNCEREVDIPDIEKPQTENPSASNDPTSTDPAASVETKTVAIDTKQGYRKQMEANRKEMQKMEKKLESDRKKIFRKQEKDKKRQMKKVQAMWGPSQSVISSVDDDDCQPSSEEENEDDAESKHQDEDDTDKVSESVNIVVDELDDDSKILAESSTSETVDCVASVIVKTERQGLQEGEVFDDSKSNQIETEAKCEPSLNLDLQKPWPPDKPSTSVDDQSITSNPNDNTDICLTEPRQMHKPDDTSSDISTCIKNLITLCDIATVKEEIISVNHTVQPPPIVKTVSRTQSPLTPSTGDRETPVTNSTPVVLCKDPTPLLKSTTTAQNVTPSGSQSGTSSASHRSSHTTPVTTPSNSTKTPTFTTPSPASSSSTSSSKSHSKHHMSKSAVSLATHPAVHRQSSQSHLMKKSSTHGKYDHHSRSRPSQHGQSSDHKRRPSHHQHRQQHGHGHRMRHESVKMKPFPSMSRRTMASITVGLDASPSKPLCKNELERLRMELEMVKSQLNLDMSPGSLSPCSGDEENGGGKSPAQLLSPASPVLRSLAENPSYKKTYYSSASPSSTGISLTDRMKLLGRVKKKAVVPGILPKPGELKPAAELERREFQFQQARLLRSNIFDQDLERLSHIQRQREEVKRREEEQREMPYPAPGVLFSNSRFLQDDTKVNGYETQLEAGVGFSTNIVQPSDLSVVVPNAASPSVSVVKLGEIDANSSIVAEHSAPTQSQISSIPGPKNVLSLSSCDLPAAAEREAHNDTGKVCNIVTDNQIVDVTQTVEENKNNIDEINSESDDTVALPDISTTTSDQHLLTPTVEIQPVNIIQTLQEHSDVLPEDSLTVQEPSVNTVEDLEEEKPTIETAPSDQPVTESGNEQVEMAEANVKSEGVTEHVGISDGKLEITADLSSQLVLPFVEEIKDSPGNNDKEPPEESEPEKPESIHQGDEYLETDMEIAGDMDIYTDDCFQVVETSVEFEANFIEGESDSVHTSNVTENNPLSGDSKEPTEDEVDVEETASETAISSGVLGKSQDAKDIIMESTCESQSQDIQKDCQDMKIVPASSVSTESTVKNEVSEEMLQPPPKQDKKEDAPEKKKVRPIEKQKKVGHSKDNKKSLISKRETVPDKIKNLSDNQDDAPMKGSGKNSSSSKLSSHKHSVPTTKPVKVADSKAEKSEVQPSKDPAAISKTKSVSGKKKVKTSSSKELVADPEKKNISKSKLPSEDKSKVSAVCKKVDHEKKVDGKSETKPGNVKAEAKEKKMGKHKKDKKSKSEKADEITDSKKTKSVPSVTSKDETVIQRQDEIIKNTEKQTAETTEASKAPVKEKQATKLMKKDSSKVDETGLTAEAKKHSFLKKKKKSKHGVDKDPSSVKSLSAGEGKSVEKASNKGKEEDQAKESDKVEKTVQKPEKSVKMKPQGKGKLIDSKKKTSNPSNGGMKRHDTTKNSGETLESKKTSSGKAVSKYDNTKKSKKHKDLKPSQSLPSTSKEKIKDLKQPSSSKKGDSQDKTNKTSSAAGPGQHTRYSLIYDSSSDDGSVASLAPPPTKKFAVNVDSCNDEDENDYQPKKDPVEEDWGTVEQKQSNWPDLDEVNAGPRRLNSSSSISSSSSSSMSDSAGPPPVFSSSLLVTETIKNETILPPDYVDYDYDSPPSLPPPVSKTQSEDSFQKKHSTVKKKSKASTSASHKDLARSKKFFKPPIRRIIMSSSSESSDDEFETSDSSDNATPLEPVLPCSNKWQKEIVQKPKQKDLFGAENDISSDGEELEKATEVTASSKAGKSVSEPKKFPKVESKSLDSGKPLKKVHQSSLKTEEKVKQDSKPKSESKIHKQKLKSKSVSTEKTLPRSTDADASVKKNVKNSEKVVEKEKKRMHSLSSVEDKSKLQKVVKESKDKVKSESLIQEEARVKEVKPERLETQVTLKKEHKHKEKEASSKVITSSSSTCSKTTSSDQIGMKEVSKLTSGKQVEGIKHGELKKAKVKERTTTEQPKDSKPKEKSSSDGKHPISSKQNIHKSKKKKDKSDKKEEKRVINKDPPAAAVKSSPVKDSARKLKEKHSQEALKALTHSLFSSDSDEDQNDKDSVPVERKPSVENITKKSQVDSVASPQENIAKLTNAGANFFSSSNLNEECNPEESVNSPTMSNKHVKVKHQSRHKHHSSAKARHLLSTVKREGKHQGNAENFLTASTTDDSDIEQRQVVQSAISSPDKDGDFQNMNDADRDEQGGLQIVEDEMSPVADFFGENRGSEKEPQQLPVPVIEDDEIDEYDPIEPEPAVDPPPEKHAAPPKHKLKTGKSKLKTKRKVAQEESTGKTKIQKDKLSEGSITHSIKKESQFFPSKHRTNFDKISRMKSLSHERDEEAVRSIVGMMDENSDADSYFSDVKPEADVSLKSSVMSTPEKDQSSGEVSNERSSACEVSLSSSVEVKDELSQEEADRIAAELNELAAAVSSIEGLFGDFPEEKSPTLGSTPHSTTPFIKQEEQQQDVVQQEEQQSELSDDINTVSQEDIDRGSSEAALAATALLMESGDDQDDSFIGYKGSKGSVALREEQDKEVTEKILNPLSSTANFEMAVQGGEKPESVNENSLEQTEKVPSASVPQEQTIHNVEAPSIPKGLADSQITTKLTSTPQISAVSTPSRKRPRQSTGASSSGRSSSHDSKSDRSYSDTSASESDYPHEVKGNRRKGVKQRRVDADEEPLSSVQSKPKDSYDFDSDLKAPSLSLPAPEVSHPFVATSAVHTSPLHQISTAISIESASIGHAHAVSQLTPQVTVQSQDVTSISTLKQVPQTAVTKQNRKTSRDSDTLCPVPTSTNRRSSSSSSSTHSPSRGSHLSQLTSPSSNAASLMQPPATMHETTFQSTAIIQPRPFVSQIHSSQPSNIQNQEARSQITLSSALPHQIPLYTNPYPVTASEGAMPNMVIPSHSQKTPPHSYVDIPRHPYTPVQASHSLAQRSLVPSPAQQRLPYPVHVPHTYATKMPSSQSVSNANSNVATSMPVFHSNAISYSSSVGLTKTTGNNAMVITANSMPSSNMLPFPPTTSFTPSRPHQFSFTQSQTGIQPQLRMLSASVPQHHIGVPTYPHNQPIQSQNQPNLSGQQPPGHLNANNLPRPSFGQPRVPAPHDVYGQPLHHIYQVSTLQNQPTIQPHPSYVMHSPNTRPPLEAPQTSPGIAQGPPLTPQHMKQKQNVQRTPSNPYLHQQAPATVPQTPTPKTSVPLQTESPHVHNPDMKKNEREAQVPPGSPHIQTLTPTQLSPQAGIRKMDQSRIPSMPRPVLPTQPMYQQLYYTPGMIQNVPGQERPYAPYPPSIHGLSPVMQFQHHPLTTAALAPQFQAGMPHGLVIRPNQLQMPPALGGEKEVAQGTRTPIKREQKNPNPNNRATPNASPHLHAQHVEPMSQPSGIVHSQAMQAHQVYLRPPSISPGAAFRPPHVDRVIHSQPDISQEDMVEQHFRKSGFPNSPRPPTPVASLAVPSAASTVPQTKTSHHGIHQTQDGHPQQRAAISPRAPRTQTEQELSGPITHPGSYPITSLPQTQPGLHPFPSGYPGMIPGVSRFEPDMQMWPRMNTFRPPSTSLLVTQQPSTQMSPRLPTHSTMAPTQTHSTTPQTHTPDSTPAARDSSTPSAAVHDAEAHNPVMDLFQRYPVIWQGLLALKNDSAAVQTHYICGDIRLAHACLPKTDSQNGSDNENNLAVLRIVQRMRLEPTQLEGVDKKMMAESDFCLLLALPCGRDKTDVIRQQSALKQGFIDYLTQKQAAGIVNIQNPQTQGQVQYVLHVFPPCEFTTAHLHQRARDLLSNINDIQHLMIVIASL